MSLKLRNQTAVVYCYTSRTTGKSYVGQTWYPLEIRYGKDGKGIHRGHFKNAVIRYGWDDFTCVIVQGGITSQVELDEAEAFWISYFGTLSPHGYNLKTGGLGGRHAFEVRRLFSQQRQGNRNGREVVRSLEQRQAQQKAMTGRVHTDASKQKRRDKMKRRWQSHCSWTVSLTDDQVREIRARYNSGTTIVQLAAEFEVSQPTVRKAIHAVGAYARTKGL